MLRPAKNGPRVHTDSFVRDYYKVCLSLNIIKTQIHGIEINFNATTKILTDSSAHQRPRRAGHGYGRRLLPVVFTSSWLPCADVAWVPIHSLSLYSMGPAYLRAIAWTAMAVGTSQGGTPLSVSREAGGAERETTAKERRNERTNDMTRHDSIATIVVHPNAG